jgi:gentisate 1,2-dioxygenase
MGEPQSQCVCFGEEKNLLHLAGIEPWIICPLSKSLCKLHYSNFQNNKQHLTLNHESKRRRNEFGYKLRKIRGKDRKQRTNIGKYSFVNRTTKNWNQLPAEALGTFPCKPKILRYRVRKSFINGMKLKE